MKKAKAVSAQPKESTIVVRLRFWTNLRGLPKGKIIPKHVWQSGYVSMTANPSHGVKGGKMVSFKSVAGIGAAVSRLLDKHKITVCSVSRPHRSC